MLSVSEIVNVVISKIWNVEGSKFDVHDVKLTRAHVRPLLHCME